jgi:hypothetical protein
MTKLNTRLNDGSYWVFLAIVLAAMGLVRPLGAAVAKRDIDSVRAKNVLNDQDLITLRDYVNEQFEQILDSNDVSVIGDLTSNIVGVASAAASVEATREVYAKSFAAAAKEGINRLLERATASKDQKIAARLRLSAAAVAGQADNIELIDTLLDLLKNDSPAVRYWAAKGLILPNVRRYLSSDQATEKYTAVIKALSDVLEKETSGPVIAQIAAVALPEKEGSAALLQKCVEKRLAAYRAWTVTSENSDIELLQNLFRAIFSTPNQEKQTAQRDLMLSAAELYSAAYYRYSKGMQYKDSAGKNIVLLSDQSQTDLQNLLIIGEPEFLRGGDVNRRRRVPGALQTNNLPELARAYEAMFAPKGIVNTEYQIFPQDDPNAGIAPLPDPPADVVERAIARSQASTESIGGDLY